MQHGLIVWPLSNRRKAEEERQGGKGGLLTHTDSFTHAHNNTSSFTITGLLAYSESFLSDILV